MNGFWTGVVTGSIMMMVLLNVIPSYHSMAYSALMKCQKSLPRDQTCVVIAIPENPEAKNE